MKDFEVHPIGTAQELAASRALATEIQQIITSYSEGILPVSIVQAYKRLYGQYIRQQQSEEYDSATTKPREEL